MSPEQTDVATVNGWLEMWLREQAEQATSIALHELEITKQLLPRAEKLVQDGRATTTEVRINARCALSLLDLIEKRENMAEVSGARVIR